MITALIVATVFAFGGLSCYAALVVSARAEEREKQKWEEYRNEFYGQNNRKQNNSKFK